MEDHHRPLGRRRKEKMRDRSWQIGLVSALALAAVPGIASAKDSMSESRMLLTPAGEYVLLGGGVTNFTNQAVRDSFNMGGAWEARVGYGTRFFVGGELAYLGVARGADTFGSNLLSNGGEAVVRLQYPADAGGWLIEPFAFGGIGWNHLFLKDATPKDSENIGVVPFGAGLTAGYGGLLLDARFAYRPTFNDQDIVLSTTGTPGNLQSWAITASIGYEF
jgi:hypothetical protein